MGYWARAPEGALRERCGCLLPCWQGGSMACARHDSHEAHAGIESVLKVERKAFCSSFPAQPPEAKQRGRRPHAVAPPHIALVGVNSWMTKRSSTSLSLGLQRRVATRGPWTLDSAYPNTCPSSPPSGALCVLSAAAAVGWAHNIHACAAPKPILTCFIYPTLPGNLRI